MRAGVVALAMTMFVATSTVAQAEVRSNAPS
jgi:hypothetical protein